MRIAFAGMSHEATTFSPLKCTLADFRVFRGSELLDHLDIAGAVQRLGIEPVPILFARAVSPSGLVEETTYLQLRDEILEGLHKAGPLDGVCLILHGSMLVDNVWSGETDLARCVRAIVGRTVPIAARLDLHASLTEEFANLMDFWGAYRTAPHRDATQTLERVMGLLVKTIQGGLRPRPVFIRPPMLIQGEKSTTSVEPMTSLLSMARDIEQKPGILNAEVLIGFAWADSAYAATSVAVTAESEQSLPLARREARRLAQAMWDAREDFVFDQEVIATADEAIDVALRAPEKTVFLADSGDNPTAGATGDTPHVLARLLAKNVPDAILAGIPDAGVTRLCFSKGEGATVSVSLGGKMDTMHGEPVAVTGVVDHLYRGDAGKKEPSIVTLRVGGVHILVTDIRRAFTTLEDFRKAGLNPLEHKIVVVKLGYLFPELRDAAQREILVLTPGCVDMDLTRLPYTITPRPIFPLDRDFPWRPIITNVAGYVD